MPSFFTRHLLKWHVENPRALPWTGGPRDAYHIWISEVIMQQTRIEQGAPFYHRFITRFPTVKALADADMDEVFRYWQGLGYYSRARNLHAAAKKIMTEYRGQFPSAYEDILRLPGVGPYSAAAIASFAFGLSYPVVDGNVKRVIARFSGLKTSIDTPAGHDEIRSLASGFINGAAPGDFNQAIMNFGALVCKPKGALCASCPLSKKCFAFQHQRVESLPVRSKKKTNTVRHFHFIVLHYRGKILLERREEKDIWHGLYAPPLLETASDRKPAVSKIHSFISDLIGHAKMDWTESTATTQQLLSHQTLIGRFHHYTLTSAPASKNKSTAWVNNQTVHQYGKPKMIAALWK